MLDGVVVENEVIDEVKQRKKECIIIKDDFEKVYYKQRNI